MSMPGFTAEESLYKTITHYVLAASWAGRPTGRVVPATECWSLNGYNHCICRPYEECGYDERNCWCMSPPPMEQESNWPPVREVMETGSPMGGGGGFDYWSGDPQMMPPDWVE